MVPLVCSALLLGTALGMRFRVYILVPALVVALTLIAKDAAHYGISTEADAPVETDMVKPGRAIDLRLVAETIDVDVSTLRALNPPLLRMATPDDPEFVLHLPKGTAERFSADRGERPRGNGEHRLE